MSPLDNRNAEFLFELPDSSRQRGLRHPARLGCPGEVLLLRQRHQVLELPDVHDSKQTRLGRSRREPCDGRAEGEPGRGVYGEPAATPVCQMDRV